MYSMKKLTALQYTIFMVAALTILITVPSAYAATLVLDASCPNKNEANGTCRAPDDGKYIWLMPAIRNAQPGDTISILNGTYDKDRNQIVISKPLTIQSASASDRVTFSGPVNLRISSDDVTIKGITFKNTTKNVPSTDTPAPVITLANGLSDVTIHNNTFRDTNGHGIRIELRPQTPLPMENLTVSDNVFKNIGTFTAPHHPWRAEKNFTAIHLVGNHAGPALGINNSKIIGNTIDTTTGGGIGLGNAKNILVQNNTISNVPGSAIGVRLGGDNIQILDNRIHNANSAVGHNQVPEDERKGGAVVFWTAGGLTNIVFSNNTISGGNNGLVYCGGICAGVKLSELADARNNLDALNATRDTDRTNTFTHNTFDNVKGFDIVNRALGTLVATNNYHGEAEPDFTKILDGDIRYNPYYNDPERRVLVDDGTGPVQKSTAHLDVSPVCSISLGSYIMDFTDAKYGATSSIIPNQIKNAGNRDLDAIKFTSTGWEKPDGSALPDAVSRVGTDVTSSASYTPITTAPAGINFDDTDFTGSNALPGPSSSDSARVGFVLDLTGVATGADVTITESVTYSATCS